MAKLPPLVFTVYPDVVSTISKMYGLLEYKSGLDHDSITKPYGDCNPIGNSGKHATLMSFDYTWDKVSDRHEYSRAELVISLSDWYKYRANKYKHIIVRASGNNNNGTINGIPFLEFSYLNRDMDDGLSTKYLSYYYDQRFQKAPTEKAKAVLSYMEKFMSIISDKNTEFNLEIVFSNTDVDTVFKL